MRAMLVVPLFAAIFLLVPASDSPLLAQQLTDTSWLLVSPLRQHLSGAGETLLLKKHGYAPTYRAWSEKAEPTPNFLTLPMLDAALKVPIANFRVNNPSADTPDLTTQSETSLAVSGSNVVVGWNDSGAVVATGNFTGYGRSTNAGTSFTDLGTFPAPAGGTHSGDPALVADGSGSFYVATLSTDGAGRSIIGVGKSTDGGATFGPQVDASPGTSSANFQDKELIDVDRTGGPFNGNIYVSWTEFFPGGTRILFSRSADGGGSFSTPLQLSTTGATVSGSIPRVGPNGEVYVAWEDRGTTPRAIRLRKSTDGGVTFGSQVTVATLTAIGFVGQCGRQQLNPAIRVNEFPIMAVDTTGGVGNGNVYLVFNADPDGAGADMSDVFFVRSTDGGATWTTPFKLNDDSTTNDQFFPFVTVAPNGTVLVMWYDRRTDPTNTEFDVYMAASTDGGVAFGPSVRVSSQSSPVVRTLPNFDPSVASCYMGDHSCPN